MQEVFKKVVRSTLATQATWGRPLPVIDDYTENRRLSAGQGALRTCTVLLDQVSLPLLMDMCTAASLLNANSSHKFFSHSPLQQPCTSHCCYDSFKIEILDVLTLTQYARALHNCHNFHFVLPNLLELDLFTS